MVLSFVYEGSGVVLLQVWQGEHTYLHSMSICDAVHDTTSDSILPTNDGLLQTVN